MRLLFTRLLMVFCMLFSVKGYAAIINWTGTTSTNWAIGSNWSGGVVPGVNDDVQIGVVSYTTGLFGSTTKHPVIQSAVSAIKSLTFGTLTAPTLTINSTFTLTVNGNVVQMHNNIVTLLGPNGVTTNLTGGGTLTCTGLFQLGDNTNPPIPVLSLGLANYTSFTTLNFSLGTLNIGTSLKLNTTSNTTLLSGNNTSSNVNNPVFNFNSGNITIGTTLNITNSTYVNTAGLNLIGIQFPSATNAAQFLMNPSTNTTTGTSAILNLAGTTALDLNADGHNAGFVDFNGSGSGSSTVNYTSANTTTAQTVYTVGAARVDTSATMYQNIGFSAAGQKNIQAGRLTISGNWASNGGKVDAVTNNPSVVFNSTSAQTLVDNGSDVVSSVANGVVFKNLLFQGTGTKTITTGKFAVDATGIMYVGSGTVPVAVGTSGSLTLNSSTSSSASVAAIPANSTITGNVNVQRMLVGGTGKAANGAYTARGYRMLSSPVQLGTSRLYGLNYIGLTALTGGSGTGFTINNSNPTIYLYREDVTPSNTTFNSGKHKGILNINGNLVDVSGGPTGFSVPIGNGYIFYFVGNTSNPTTKASANPTTGPENTIITATGTLNQQNVLVSLWYTPAGATGGNAGKLSFNSALGTSAGYNMVGNPYAATIDLNSVISTNSSATGIQNSIYVLDNVNPGQQYVVYSTAGGSSPRANRYLASGQGFIVKARAANSTLTFQEANKAVSSQPSPLLMGIPLASQNGPTGLYVKMERDSLIADYCGVYFSGSSSANFDDEDAKDLDGTSSQIYMSSYTADGVRTAVNHMPDYINGSRVRLYINSSADGIHKLRVEDVRNIDTLYNIWLKDKYKKDSLDIRRYGTYNFNVVRSDTATYGGNRFELVIRRKPLPPYQLIDFTAAKTTEGVKLNWKTYNEGNFTGFTVEKLQESTGQYSPLYSQQSNSKTDYAYTDITPVKGVNTYRLQQNDIDGKITWSKPVSISIADDPTLTIKANLISVYPNPAAAMINVSVNPQTPANGYTAKIYSYTGAIVSRQKVSGNNWTQDVTQLQPGTYIIELNKANGELVGRSKFIKR